MSYIHEKDSLIKEFKRIKYILNAKRLDTGVLIPTNTTIPSFFDLLNSAILRELAATFTKLNRQG